MDLDLASVPSAASTTMMVAVVATSDPSASSSSSSSAAQSELVALRASVHQLEQIVASHELHTQRIIEQMRHEWRAAAAAAAHPAASVVGASLSRRSSLSVSPAPAHAPDPATLSLKESVSARSRRGSIDPSSSSSSHDLVSAHADATQTNGCPHCTCKHNKVKSTRLQRWMRKFSLCTGCMFLLPVLGVSVCWLIYQSRDHLQFLYRVQRYHNDWCERVSHRPKPMQAAADRLQAMRATRDPLPSGVVGAIVHHTHIPAAGAATTNKMPWAPTNSSSSSAGTS